MIEAALANVNFELSQGSHFFHNVTGFGVYYFSLPFEKTKTIDWQWLQEIACLKMKHKWLGMSA